MLLAPGSRDVVIVAGLPGAGKTTLAACEPRALDSDHVRAAWARRLGAIPYPLWRPLVHARHWVALWGALGRADGVVVVRPFTTAWLRRAVLCHARRHHRAVHLLVVDATPSQARAGQQARGRRVGERAMRRHERRWASADLTGEGWTTVLRVPRGADSERIVSLLSADSVIAAPSLGAHHHTPAQRAMAERAGSTTTEAPDSHPSPRVTPAAAQSTPGAGTARSQGPGSGFSGMDDHTQRHDHGDGLHEDLAKLATRRDALRIFGAGGTAAILGTLGASRAFAATPTAKVPTETAGPYPGDGSNGPNVLDDSGIVRHDIRRSFGSSRTLAKGVPLRVNLTVTQAAKDYAPLAGAAVYLWHCDRSGRYSMYSSGVEDENYLRGIAKTNDHGTAWFRTIFPAAYSGRWPHIHFEVYKSLATAVASGPIVKSSQLALPKAVCKKVYATSGYGNSQSNLARSSLATDNVFSDDRAIHQLATVTGNVHEGFVANLTIAV